MIANLLSKSIQIRPGVELAKARVLRRLKVERMKQQKSIKRKLRRNRNVIANSYKELGRTQTVKMKINTGDHSPVKLGPYRKPIHKRELVEQAV